MLALPLRRALLMLVLFATSGCSLLAFIEDRLPPPATTERGVLFRFKEPAARQVNLAGEFNNWVGTSDGRLDPNIDPMTDPDGDGIWEIILPLPPGRYQYKFVIDQAVWREDPSHQESVDDGFGGKNSILVIPSDVPYEYPDNYISTSLATAARSQRLVDYTFELQGYPDATDVFVTGSFAAWNEQAYRMEKGVSGVWRATIEIPSGSHLYKFVVDGEWIADPDNPATADDGMGGVNSVVEIQS